MSILTEQEIRSVEDGSPEYRAISGLAIAGLLLGAASMVALGHAAFWGLPLLALGVNVWALRQIRQQPEGLKGRFAALMGTALALTFGFSAPLVAIGNEIANRREAIEVARHWFEALRENHPDIAHQWTMPRWMRVKEGDYVPSHYNNKSGKQAMQQFLRQPAVHALLDLGKRAHVRYYSNAASESDDEKRTIVDVYVVTIAEGPDQVSFVLKLTVTARLDTTFKQWSWELTKCEIMSEMPVS